MSASQPASVSVRDLHKRYGPATAVRGVSFEVTAGEIFGLLGPNGAGKTTTLECLLGLRRPDAGAIAIDGIDGLSQPEMARQLVGAQLQGATLQDKITPREALGLFASFYRQPAGVDDLLERFGLVEKAGAGFDSLSGGQRQRLFLALAFVSNPRLVVLDEPTAGLDPRARRELHGMIRAARAAGRTVLLSTHDLEEAGSLCDRVAIVDAGRIVALAAPAELIARSRTLPRVILRTARPLAAAQVRDLPGVVGCQPAGSGWVLETNDVGRTILGATTQIEAAGNQLLDLQIRQPSLEDVFLELTGRVWPEPPPDEAT